MFFDVQHCFIYSICVINKRFRRNSDVLYVSYIMMYLFNYTKTNENYHIGINFIQINIE